MPLNEKDIDKVLQQVKENTRTDCIDIKTKICRYRLPITCSKFGGFPYWPKDKLDTYPVSDRGLALTLLAQINLADLPENDVFPKQGMLQFFLYDLMDVDNYKVVLHENITEPADFIGGKPAIPTSLTPNEAEITLPSGEKKIASNSWWGKEFPITGEFALEFSKRDDFVNPTEARFNAEFDKAAEQLGISIPDGFDAEADLSNEIINSFYEYGGGHKLLGRPCFVQGDIRYQDDVTKMLLFQIDSAWPQSGREDDCHFINFGDAGTAGFFIEKDDLAQLNFSNVIYDWQCC